MKVYVLSKKCRMARTDTLGDGFEYTNVHEEARILGVYLTEAEALTAMEKQPDSGRASFSVLEFTINMGRD